MAERWGQDERPYRPDDRDYRSRQYGERDRTDRAADEVRSWFGDDQAAQRRRMDEYRDGRGERDWNDRPSNAMERNWDRTKQSMRDATDWDRDGRRGFAEWNDSDRSWDRGRSDTVEPSRLSRDYGHRGYAETRSYSGGYTGPYAGRGPKGYTRGDERIREDVCDRLTDDPRIDASDIDVQVKNGEVSLSGSVRSREEKRYSEDLIEHLTGVRDVNNQLKVKAADAVIGTARSGASMLGLTDTPPPEPTRTK
jgi:osmotically-inducible protein OsmY